MGAKPVGKVLFFALVLFGAGWGWLANFSQKQKSLLARAAAQGGFWEKTLRHF